MCSLLRFLYHFYLIEQEEPAINNNSIDIDPIEDDDSEVDDLSLSPNEKT